MCSILLVNTSFHRNIQESSRTLYPPMGLLSVAGSLKAAGYGVKLIDPQIDYNFMKNIELEVKKGPIFVGMTTFMGRNIHNAREISNYIKNIDQNISIVWGGPMATSSPDICFKTKNAGVDYIVMGMGEETVVKLADAIKRKEDPSSLNHISSCINGNLQIKENYFFTGDLDFIENPYFPLWEEGIRKTGQIPIISSRGCPRNCAFCYNNTFTGRKRWFSRSEENVIQEMQRWSDSFGFSNFYFIDDNFLVNTKRACNILKQSIERNFRIGQLIGHLYDFKPQIFEFLFDYIDHVGFAIESASSRIQKIINKVLDLDKAIYLLEHLSNNNISVITTNFMFGFPSETDDDIRANIEMAVKIRSINNKIRIVPYIYTPQPKDDILPQFEVSKNMEFTFETLSHFDLAPNRSNFLSQDIRPWMSKEDIQFYLDLNLVWFYHFDHVVRNSQDIDIKYIYEQNDRVAKLFRDVQYPIGD